MILLTVYKKMQREKQPQELQTWELKQLLRISMTRYFQKPPSLLKRLTLAERKKKDQTHNKWKTHLQEQEDANALAQDQVLLKPHFSLLETAAATGATAGGGAAMGSGTTTVSFMKKKLGHKKKLLDLNLTLLNETPPVEVEPSSEAAVHLMSLRESLDKMKIMVDAVAELRSTASSQLRKRKAPESGLVA